MTDIHEEYFAKFIYFEKATKFCKISNLDLTVNVKYKVVILQHRVAFSQNLNFNDYETFVYKVHIFWGGHKKLKKKPNFDVTSESEENFSTIFGLIRIYEL